MQSFEEFYNTSIIPSLINKFNYKNYYQVPKIVKIKLVFTVNDTKSLHNETVLVSLQALQILGGYNSYPTILQDFNSSYSKDKITVCENTLEGNILYNFLTRFITLDLPSLKFFQGFSFGSSQEGGSYRFTINDPLAFFDLGEEYEKFNSLKNLDIIFFTTCNSLEECKAFFNLLQIPIITKNDTTKNELIR